MRNSRREDSRALLRKAAVVLIILLVLSMLFVGLRMLESKSVFSFGGEGRTQKKEVTLEYNGQKYAFDRDVENFLVIGVDKYESDIHHDEGFRNDQQADFLFLFTINHREHTCSAIHLNRDTVTDVDILGIAGNKLGTEKMQLALSHTYGNGEEASCQNSVDAVSRLLCNIPIEHYIAVTMDAVGIFNDAVGGVTVKVLDDFPDDSVLVKGKTVTLSGDQALRYVRARSEMAEPTNVARMARQRQYIAELYEQLRRKIGEDDNFVADVAKQLGSAVTTNCLLSEYREFSEELENNSFDDIYNLRGELAEVDGLMAFTPDENALKKLLVSLMFLPK